MTARLRTGVIGAGIVAQVMHLNYLRELPDEFDVVALCDLSQDAAQQSAERFGIPETYTDWHTLLEQPLDAVLILTSGSHAPIAIEAAQKGIHVFTEKPMCFDVPEGEQMVAAAHDAGVVLMVGYPKRFDPAYERFVDEMRTVEDLRLVRVTTFESPFVPYVEQYHLSKDVTPPPGDVLDALREQSRATLSGAIGSQDPFLLRMYHEVMLDSLIHELNTVRSVLGEPTRLDYVDMRESGVTAVLRFGEVPCVINWIDLPGMTRYRQEFAFYSPNRRLTLAFPSPFLRSAPTILEDEGGEIGTGRSWHTEEVSSYDEAFKRELLHFHHCVTTGEEPRTSGGDGLRDVKLCASFVASFVGGHPVDDPANPAAGR